ncbi:hypothetical protein Hanom_Chr12g01085541 [Helianthus anomalus]
MEKGHVGLIFVVYSIQSNRMTQTLAARRISPIARQMMLPLVAIAYRSSLVAYPFSLITAVFAYCVYVVLSFIAYRLSHSLVSLN